jgi:hypothetical protein
LPLRQRESRRASSPLRQPAPPALPRWAHSRCHHRFCGLCRLGRRREAKSATGLKSHSIAHVLPRPALTMLPEAGERDQASPQLRCQLRCQAPERGCDVLSTSLALWLCARHDRAAGGRPVNDTYRP